MSENNPSNPNLAVGIDLGTTNSLSAFVYSGGTAIVKNGERDTFTPSAVCLTNGEVFIGKEALVKRVEFPRTTFTSFKRFMGTGLINEGLSLPYQIEKGPRNNIIFKTESGVITPEELSAHVLRKIKLDSEYILGATVDRAVITVPAYFDDAQRQATRNAGEISGLKVLRIINEPTAAALAYGLDKKAEESGHTGKIAIYDLGGGTFDVSVLDLKAKIFRVLSTKGDTKLGGDDFDELIIEDICRQFGLNSHWFDPADRQSLKKLAESIKIQLTLSPIIERNIYIPSIGKSFLYSLKREIFEQLISPLIDKTIVCLKTAISEAGLTNDGIAEIVLVGGSTRIPFVRHKVGEFFGKLPHTRINPDHVVAVGAATQAHALTGGKKEVVLMDILPLSLGIETVGGTFSKLLVKNGSIPAKYTETYSTSVDNQTGINIRIFQGEREMVRDCRFLGEIKLKNIPPMPAGLPRLEVTFAVDVNGILNVTANELRSGQTASVEIVPEHGLHPQEVRQMVMDSMTFAIEDYKARNLEDFRVKARMVLAGYEKNRNEIKNKLSSEEFNAIENCAINIRNALSLDDPNKLNSFLDEFGKLTADVTDQILSSTIKNYLTQNT